MELELKNPDLIEARIDRYANQGDDPFGFAREVLLDGLEWGEVRPVHEQARGYYQFALGKAQDHRGLSAGRSVVKLAEFAWLLGQDELSAQMRTMADSEKFAPYGAPILKHFAEGMRLVYPDDGNNYLLWRMGNGWPCRPDCDMGCRPSSDDRVGGALL